MLNSLVLLSAMFVALTVKSKIPAVVGVPKISPVFGFKFNPFGKLPLSIAQVIGAVPVALSV